MKCRALQLFCSECVKQHHTNKTFEALYVVQLIKNYYELIKSNVRK